MRIAFFTPLAPSPTGTADYATELLPYLRQGVEVEVFVDPVHTPMSSRRFARDLAVYPYKDFELLRRTRHYDVILYAIGNNPFHQYVYRTALRYPGVLLLHDFNLHHLIAYLTVVNNNWEEYFRLVEEEGGAPALERAQRVRKGLIGPDYENLTLNGRLLRHSLGAITHSHYVGGLIRDAQPELPVCVIYHGVRQVDVTPKKIAEVRQHLQLPEDHLLLGSFGFLKPYKRISSCLAALAQVQSDLPPCRYLLVGEEHPDYPVQEEIRRFGLENKVILTGRVDLEQFWNYILAADIGLTLRYPTAGETSGGLLRQLAAAKAVIISNVGAFAEWPDNCCAKADIDGCEIPQLVAYLKLLGGNPLIREQLGKNAQVFVRQQCSWEQAADLYCKFLSSFTERSTSKHIGVGALVRCLPDDPAQIESFILDFFQDRPRAQDYARQHMKRLLETLAWVPRADPGARLLEIGCYLQMTPVLAKYYGYAEVRGSYFGPAGKTDYKEIVRANTGERYLFQIDLFDAEKDPFPYPDTSFRTVLCCELLEHLDSDPLHMLWEINRILEPQGYLLLTTPNTASWKSLAAILRGSHPALFPAFLQEPGVGGGRHAREYTPCEVQLLLSVAGFELVRLETHDFYGRLAVDPRVRTAAIAAGYQEAWGGDTILVLARKTGPPTERYPREFYC